MPPSVASLCRTLAGTFTFSGRTPRRDVGIYWLASLLIGALLHRAADLLWDVPDVELAYEVADLIVCIPIFALFVRRLHDQGRTGWWCLMLLPFLPLNVYERLRVMRHAFDPAWPDPGYWSLLVLPILYFAFAFLACPGDSGPNLYGPDPRPEPRIRETA